MLFIREEDQWLTLSSVCGSDGCHRSLAEILSSLAAYLLEKKVRQDLFYLKDNVISCSIL